MFNYKKKEKKIPCTSIEHTSLRNRGIVFCYSSMHIYNYITTTPQQVFLQWAVSIGCGKIIQESEKSSLVTGAKNELYGLDYYNNDYINLRSKYMTKEEITKFDKLINERVSFVTDPQEYLNNRMMRGIAFDQFYEIIADNIIELRER